MNEYLSSELEKVSSIRQWIDGQKNASFLGISKKVDEKNKKIVNPLKIKKVTPFSGPKSGRNDDDKKSEKSTGKNKKNKDGFKSARSGKNKTDRSVSQGANAEKINEKKQSISFNLEDK